jgi:hypothetical protein
LAHLRHRNETISIGIAEEDPVIAQEQRLGPLFPNLCCDNILLVPIAAIFDIAAFFVVDGFHAAGIFSGYVGQTHQTQFPRKRAAIALEEGVLV